MHQNLILLTTEFFDKHFNNRCKNSRDNLRDVTYVTDSYFLKRDFPLLNGKSDDYFYITIAHHANEMRTIVKGYPTNKFYEDLLKYYPEKLI